MNKTCKVCGTEFENKGCYQIYCSRKCNAKSWARKNSGWKPLASRSCCICGKIFMPDAFHPNAKTCSQSCNRKNDYKIHREKRIKQVCRWQRLNAEKCLKYQRQNYWRHLPDKRIFHRNRMYRRRTNCSRGDMTISQWHEIERLQKGKCWWCGKDSKLDMDHLIPITKGGLHTFKNIVGSCRSCNSKKGAKLWARESGALAHLQDGRYASWMEAKMALENPLQ